MLAFHIIAMVSTTLGAIIKTILLLFNRRETFLKVQTKTKLPIQILLISGVFAGIYMVVTKFGGIVPIWLQVKLGLFIVGGILVMIAEKKENKILLSIGTLMLLMAYLQANIKLS